MTKKELLAKLKMAKQNPDTEEGHWDADAALVRYINDEDIREAFQDVPKWYACYSW